MRYPIEDSGFQVHIYPAVRTYAKCLHKTGLFRSLLCSDRCEGFFGCKPHIFAVSSINRISVDYVRTLLSFRADSAKIHLDRTYIAKFIDSFLRKDGITILRIAHN
ncbi:hypothetical protein L596_006424 [Steinernema carpocapsae]|uniref:Uncharacterized protein n=1 Tax=Steinernema carpocapsae TaxID=34508 RepID=A0A4U8VA73_STECR|nr:hypothetical protein L596_006424 [Steinernema carpocapsae]